ncbi:uncharacterized protein LOC109710489 [Ananas comosus]|uniref:Uncharacterized protein LOC109710489 n=2 Tax=Ananas comosus TaxID=4615 RepID=A0A6P5F607_ANACO|nr:uncharacterized protein LOC109710489 [Ananas comosus]
MASVVSFACAKPIVSPTPKSSHALPTEAPKFHLLSHPNPNFHSLKAKATESNQSTKKTSIVCICCEGNGAVLCTQCKGTGVNSVDHFNGQFKAGASCWLCRGKREILCGNCNGAGFMGGFLSTFDETAQ